MLFYLTFSGTALAPELEVLQEVGEEDKVADDGEILAKALAFPWIGIK